MKFLFLSFALMVSGVALPAAGQWYVGDTRAHLYGGIKTSLDAFAVDCGRYPTTSEGFKALLTCPTNIPSGRWHGPYFDPPKIPQDPWENNYVYRYPGVHNTNGYDLYSCGFDRISRSGGDDLDDINNWDPASPHGGNDRYFNNRQMFDSILDDSPQFHTFILIFQVVPFLCGVRLIASIFSRRVRASITRHPTVHIIWFVVSLAAIVLFLLSCIHRIAGR